MIPPMDCQPARKKEAGTTTVMDSPGLREVASIAVAGRLASGEYVYSVTTIRLVTDSLPRLRRMA